MAAVDHSRISRLLARRNQWRQRQMICLTICVRCGLVQQFAGVIQSRELSRADIANLQAILIHIVAWCSAKQKPKYKNLVEKSRARGFPHKELIFRLLTALLRTLIFRG
ncbi:hypothetical protein LDD39_04940 [Lactobacillus delbrueckii subsp. delbrueckii]|nr:hypothetical protein LDD39_04940 [Lactobacillus delbrueckii subsp. delbrueckii]